MVTCHKHLHNVLAETCHKAHLSMKVEMGSNLTPDHDHSCPADILLPNWALGKPAAFDILETSPLNPKVAGLEPPCLLRNENIELTTQSALPWAGVVYH